MWYCLLLLTPTGEFHDGSTFEGRSTVTYQPVTWTQLDGTVQQGSLPLGKDGKRLRLRWNAKAAELGIDLDDNDQFDAKERFTLTDRAQEVPIKVDDKQRTLLARLRDDAPAFAVRGYSTGVVELDGAARRYALLDGDADGCFHRPGHDRLLLDIDGDGKLDRLTEQFTLGEAIRVGKDGYLASASPDGTELTLRKRPDERGEIRFHLEPLGGGKVRNVQIELVSEFGEYQVLRDLESFAKLPVGGFRVMRLKFEIERNPSEVWSYSFWGSQKTFDLKVDSKRSDYELLPKLALRGRLTTPKEVAPGQIARVQGSLESANGLVLSEMSNTAEHTGGIRVELEATLNEPGSLRLDRNVGCLH